MTALTIRLPDKVANEVKKRAQKLHISRSEYIRKSIESMNKKMHQQERANALVDASRRVRKESMTVNLEFSRVEYDPET